MGLGFVSHGFAKHPFISSASYAALVSIASAHFVWGVAKWNGWIPTGTTKKAKWEWWSIHAATVALASLWMSGGLGIVARGGLADGWIGKSYDVLYSKVSLV